MRILKVIHGYPPTYNAGSEVYSQTICEHLSQKHLIHVFSREQNEYELDFSVREDFRNEIPITLLNLAREKDGYEHPQVNRAFANLITQFRPDIIHIGHLNHLSLGIVKIAWKKRIPIVFTLHDFWLMCPRGQFLQRNFDGKNLYRLCESQEDSKCAKNCYRMLHSCAEKDMETDLNYWTNWVKRRMTAVSEIIPLIDQFIAPSHYLKQRFIKDFGIADAKILYLDYGFPLHYLQPIKRKKNTLFTFTYIGTHQPAKGINLLINAFKQLQSPAQLNIWGRAIGQNTTALKRLTKGSKNPIHFKGEYQNRNIANQVLSETDIVVVPSIWGENSPLVIHEAQACQIPVITADFGGMKEYVTHLQNGLLFEHRNEQSLFNQMEWAVSHPKKMKELGKKGYLFSENGKVQSIASHCEILEKIYQKTLNEYHTRTLENYH